MRKLSNREIKKDPFILFPVEWKHRITFLQLFFTSYLYTQAVLNLKKKKANTANTQHI